MKITKIYTQKKEGRLNLDVDETFFCSVSVNTIASLNLYKDKEVSEEDLNRILKVELENRFFDRAFTLTSNRLKSKKQVLTYLKELSYKKKGKWFVSENINFDEIFDKVINRLEKVGLLNDYEYARAFIQSRMNSKPRGISQIKSELFLKGISKEIIENIFYEVSPDNEDLIEKVFRKKYKEKILDTKDNKMVGYLLRKGFDWDDISKLERKLRDDTRE